MRQSIFIDSATRDYGTSSDFVVSINNSQMHPRRIRLQSACIPFTWYPINEYCNEIIFDEGAGQLIATLTPGVYTYTTLAAEIKSALEAAGSNTYTVSFNETKMRFTIAGSGSFSLLMSLSSAYQVLGFEKTDVASALSHTAPNFPVLSSPSTLYIRSHALRGLIGGNLINGTKSNVIQVINVTAEQGFYIYWESPNDVWSDVAGGNESALPQNIDIQITDYRGRVVDLGGVDCKFEILLA